MSWRIRLAIVCAALLPVPLVGLLGAGLYGWQWPSKVEGTRWKVVPRLSAGEAGQLVTLGQGCRGDQDCEPPLICLRGVAQVKARCAHSQCMTDAECAPGTTCGSVVVSGGRAIIRLCGVVGERKEGELCHMWPRHREEGCEQGLVCAGWCGRPCHPERTESCPEGFFCGTSSPNGPSCLPTCEGRACPEGEQCVRFEGGSSLCARVRGRECQLEGCPEGQVCEVQFPKPWWFKGSEKPEQLASIQQGRQVWMRCSLACEVGSGSCPSGSVCSEGVCSKPCSPEGASTCGPDEKCTEFKALGHRACTFDMDS